MKLGEQIRMARLARRIGLRQLARDVGRSSSMLSRIEAGEVMPGVDLVRSLASVLNLDADSLFCAAGHVPPDLAARLTDPTTCRAVRDLLGKSA